MGNLLLWHAFVTFAMTGLIWFVQVVHYPLFAAVGAEGFANYEALHSGRTTLVVAPLMVFELSTALLLLMDPAWRPDWRVWAGMALVLAVWLFTFLLQVPEHNVLARGFDAAAADRLVSSNWVRTLAWSLRSALLLWMLGSPAGAARIQ